MSSAPRALVTGGSGFIGANLVRRLLREGHEVHVVLGPGDHWRLADVLQDVRVHELRLEDEDKVGQAVAAAAPDLVFHLAAHGAYSSQTDLQRMVATNVAGTVNLVEAALRSGVRAVVHTGSSSEYGLKDHAPREDEWIDPNSHYAFTKAAATSYCRYSSLKTELPITTLRLYSVYGPWEEPTRLLPTLAVCALDGRLPPLVSPTIARDYVEVEDVVGACLAAAAEDVPLGAVYNVGSGQQTSMAELVELVRSELGVAAQPEWGSMPERLWDTDVWVADPRRIEKELGWRAATPLGAGIRRLAEWLRSDPRRLDRYQQQRTPPQ